MDNKDKDIAAKCQQLYQMSLKNLEGDNPDLADEVVVALWKTTEKLLNEKKTLEKMLAEVYKENREYYHKQDILETRLAIMGKNQQKEENKE